MIRLFAMDLDGTLTQHKTPLEDAQRQTLLRLSQKYQLLIVGAGECQRIFNQTRFPMPSLGNYGMQYAEYDPKIDDIRLLRDDVVPCDREEIKRRCDLLRREFGFLSYAGESVEFLRSGCVSFPCLGTAAVIADKLRFDPDRKKRRPLRAKIAELFPEYTVFLGGSSSFDMAPKPYNKYDALSRYCEEHGFSHDEVVFAGDDFGEGGNDEPIFKSDFRAVPVLRYTRFAEAVRDYL